MKVNRFRELQPALLRKLHTDWFEQLAADAGIHFEQTQPRNPVLLQTSDGLEVALEAIAEPPFIRFRACDPAHEEQIESLVRKATERIEVGDPGGFVWHHVPFTERDFAFRWRNPFGILFQRLASQAIISGWYRVGEDVLLEFSQAELPDSNVQPIFAANTTINAYIRVAAPRVGVFSEFCANCLVEPIGAVCTFALGRAVVGPPISLEADPDRLVELEQRLADRNVPSLTRKNVSLDFLSARDRPGGNEYFEKLCTALITFESAFDIAHDAVACALYVVVAEGLATPAASWSKQKVTERFVSFYEEMVPGFLDSMIHQPEFESIFGIKRGRRTSRALRRALLNALYEYRSVRVHQGFPLSLRDIVDDVRKREDQQRAFFCAFAEAAILSYLGAPRCSLVGKLDGPQPVRLLTKTPG